MPARHPVTADGQGITLVNIGVGPSNAKTIYNHLPCCGLTSGFLMIKHCGGLRESQAIGDYVLAHAYLRDDHVLMPFCRPIFLFRYCGSGCSVRFRTTLPKRLAECP